MKAIFDDNHKQIVSEIKKARIKSGLSQKDLSIKLGHSQSYISKIESGQVRLDIVQLRNISKALNLKFEEFLK